MRALELLLAPGVEWPTLLKTGNGGERSRSKRRWPSPKGPTVAEDGTIYFTDLGNNRIMQLSTDGQLSTFRESSNQANGLIFDREWRLLACEGGDGETVLPRVTRTDMVTGEVEVLADAYEGKQLHRPNDLTLDGQGRIYFTDRAGPNPRPEQTGCTASTGLTRTARSSES